VTPPAVPASIGCVVRRKVDATWWAGKGNWVSAADLVTEVTALSVLAAVLEGLAFWIPKQW
jgi:hypothetical protein